jgi:pseudoazurin
MRFKKIVLVIGILLSATFCSVAETHLVEMRNTDPSDPNNINLFDPPILRIGKGDSVKFVAIDKGHNSASKKGMLPEGGMPWNSRLDEELEITFDHDGTYGYICIPHLHMGMVGLILVGDYQVNYEEAKNVRQRGGARKAFSALFKQVDTAAVNQGR